MLTKLISSAKAPLVSFCIVPQASQEDQLHSFKSYSDVAMFHYTVPKEIEQATWQFAAFMDNPICQPRKVYIHLKFGSYPVISTNNRTFLTNTYVKHDDSIIVTTTTIYGQNNATVVPIYGPQSGDWFVAAYMSYWNERIQQQGFGHKCQYSIGTIALWSQENNIENIPVGYKMILRTSTRKSYYKIYIPSGIWNFRLLVWNCTFVLHNFYDIREPCIEAISLKGRVLPIFNYSHPMEFKNVTTNASYTFTEFSPYEDSYYYLLIVSSSVIEFNVKIEVSECPIKMKSFMKEFTGIALNLNSTRELNINKHKWYYKGNNISRFYRKFYKRNKEYEIDNSCITRYQLVRVKHAETFSAAYLLQEKERLSSRLVLIDSIPVMTQFDILPLIDIGGTLDVSVHLEIDKLPSKQSTLVTLCLQKGRIPKLSNHHSCQNGTLSMNLSSLDKHNAKLLIAYPQPDTWYIIIYAACYYDGKPVNCQHKEISILLNINTGKCMLSNHNLCGNHGVCQEIQKNILHYATCNCFEGYTGWDCTDITSPAIFSFISTILLIFSNAFLIPAIYIAIKRKLYAEGLVYLATMLISSLYHACDQNGGQFCIVKYEILQYSDFFSSILAFWMTLIAMAKLSTDLIPLCHIMGVFIITIGVQIDRTGLISILIPLLMGIVIPIITYVCRIFRIKRCKKPSKKTSLGLLFAITGLLLYSFIETKENYYVIPTSTRLLIRTMVKVPKLGLMLVGWGGNNGSTITAALLANKLKLFWETKEGLKTANWYGSLTQASTVRLGRKSKGEDVYVPISSMLPMVNPNDIEIDGWDISDMNLAEAMTRAKVLDINLQIQLRPYMMHMRPRKSIYYPDFIASNQGKRANNIITGTKAEQLNWIRNDIVQFKASKSLDQVIVLWTANTERFSEIITGVNDTADNLLKAIDENHLEISPSTMFAVAAALEGCTYINGSPQNTFVPGALQLAERQKTFVSGDDFKSGQTKLKSVLVDFLISAGIKPVSIVSYNHLGNNDGYNLSAPQQFRSKEISKSNVVDDMVESNKILYKPGEKPDHCIVIKYVPYVGDSKRAMDEYTSEIMLGGHNTIVIHNTCEDSLLATPIILDLVILAELCSRITLKRADSNDDEEFFGFHSVLSILSYLCKAPLVPQGTPVVNALSRQRAAIENILRACLSLPPENNMLLEHKVSIKI